MTIVDFSATPWGNNVGAENTQLEKATGYISGLFDYVYSSIETVLYILWKKKWQKAKKNKSK